jgi:hypothetical protein
MAKLLYGSGLRLMECLRVRVKDFDFALHQITVHDGQGEKDRVTMPTRNRSGSTSFLPIGFPLAPAAASCTVTTCTPVLSRAEGKAACRRPSAPHRPVLSLPKYPNVRPFVLGRRAAPGSSDSLASATRHRRSVYAIPRSEVGLDDPALHVRARFPLRATTVCQSLPHVNGPVLGRLVLSGQGQGRTDTGSGTSADAHLRLSTLSTTRVCFTATIATSFTAHGANDNGPVLRHCTERFSPISLDLLPRTAQSGSSQSLGTRRMVNSYTGNSIGASSASSWNVVVGKLSLRYGS